MAEGGGEDEVAADDGRQNTAGVDRHVSRCPECVSADGAMPGDVPCAADGGRGDGKYAAPDVPGDGDSFCGGIGDGGCSDKILQSLSEFYNDRALGLIRSNDLFAD